MDVKAFLGVNGVMMNRMMICTISYIVVSKVNELLLEKRRCCYAWLLASALFEIDSCACLSISFVSFLYFCY